MYDYIIVGAGPSGLILSHYLAKENKKILLIERESSIGGCHRVRRVDGYFTEHGPRIYLTSYFTLNAVIQDLGGEWSDYFTDYISLKSMTEPILKALSGGEMWSFAKAYIKFAFSGDWAKRQSVYEFMVENNFSSDAKDYIDRICRMTDGADSTRYLMYEFLNLLNQNALYKIQQPRKALDKGLFKRWKEYLDERIEIRLGEEADLMVDPYTLQLKSGEVLKSKNILFAIPPVHILNILEKSFNRDIFGDFKSLKSWSTKTKYLTYIPITFHFSSKIKLEEKWGYPQFDWGLATVVLSDYFDEGEESPTLISTAISIIDKQSSITGKSANQTTSVDELINETFRQLKLMYPSLPPYSKAILSEGVYHNGTSYISTDSAFMWTKDGYWSEESKYTSIQWIGIHQGNSPYAFTSFQSASDNALKYLGKDIDRPLTLGGLIVFVITILILILTLRFK